MLTNRRTGGELVTLKGGGGGDKKGGSFSIPFRKHS